MALHALRLMMVGLAAGRLATEMARADWPQWRGPRRDDVSTETGLQKAWPEAGPPRIWLFEECGLGYAGPAIVGGRLYIMGTRDGREALLALDASTGSELWATPFGDLFQNDWGDGPRSTPTVDGDLAYCLGAQGKLVCVRAESGEVVWMKAMQDLGGATPAWGYSESPIIHGDNILCTPGGPNGAVAALDKRTGELRWQMTDATSAAHYSSIVLMQHDGHDEAVQLLPDQLIGFSPVSGKLLWTVPWPRPVAAIPTPIVREQYVYATSGYGVGCKLVKIGPEHSTEVVYDNKVMKNKHGGVILVGDYLYGHSDGVGWVCQDFATGEQVWRNRDALGMGAVAYADGMLYCLSEDAGEVVLVEASPAGWNERGRFTLEPQSTLRKDRGRIWVHPVICDGRLYLRDQNVVACYDVREKPAEVSGGQ
ncbi:MAG TPA: PQQ-like beta-propeller repeat protein [Lacipirellulaceae bacterium]|nr:PQQ-like beta-propeller repeat protein [Lacipirellulaceae bacterium]